MRRTFPGVLVLLAAAFALTARAEGPYAGTWKLTVIPDQRELSLWLIKIDKEGKKVEVVTGLGPYKDSTLSNVKAEPGRLRFNLKGRFGDFEFFFTPGKDRDTLLGALRVGYDFIPVRLEKSDLTELNPKAAVGPIGGMPDLQSAMKAADTDGKIKELKEVLKSYEDRPLVILASQVLIGQLREKKAKGEEYKLPAEAYYKFAALHGRYMRIGAGKTISRVLVGIDGAAPVALDYAEKAVKLLKKDDNRGVQLTTYIALANAQEAADKKDAIKGTLASIQEVAMAARKNLRPGATEQGVTQAIAGMLLSSRSPTVADLGLEYARDAVKLVKDDDPLEARVESLKLLRNALFLRGKTDESKKVAASVEGLESKLDAEYQKTAIPFKPEKFAGRKGKSDRVVLVELFTGAQCPPCIAADVAFDAALASYSPKDLVALQYHVHIPAPDPLANPDTLARAKFYDDIESAPTMLLNGEVTKPMGGSKERSKASFDALREMIDKQLEMTSEATLKLNVKRNGEKIDVSVEVADLKETGATIKLRLALVEDVVRYNGRNRQRLHHHVVRALLGGNDGFKLENKSSSHTASINVAELRKKLASYLAQYARKQPFPNSDRPLDLKKLKIVALVQDDITRRILQAVQVDVPEAK